MGKKWDYDVPSIEIWKEILRVLKPGGTALIFAGSRTQHRMACNVEDAGFILKDTIIWLYGSGMPKSQSISKMIDKKLGKKGKIIGYRNDGIGTNSGSKIYNMNDKDSTMKKNFNIIEPETKEAKEWVGFNTHGLKPAYEPILVAIKPNDETYANNALKWGVAGLNIDESRIGNNGGTIHTDGEKEYNNEIYGKGLYKEFGKKVKGLGRFPANIILDEEAAKMLDEQVLMTSMGRLGTSRFFYCAKASKSERNTGCEELEEKLGGSLEGGNDTRNGKNKPQLTLRKNFHPTVKPLKLLEYLCILTKTPLGGTVLDPFMGSGTTGVACVNTNRDFIGIELGKDYFEIAQKRIEYAQKKIENVKNQLNLF